MSISLLVAYSGGPGPKVGGCLMPCYIHHVN